MYNICAYSKFVKTIIVDDSFIYIPNKSTVQSVQIDDLVISPVNGIINITTAIDNKIGMHNVDLTAHTVAINQQTAAKITAHNNDLNAHSGVFTLSKPDNVNLLITENDKINSLYLPDTIVGQLKYGGTFNGSGTITATVETTAINGYKIDLIDTTTYDGYYFIATAPYTLNNIAYATGDWAIAQAGEMPTFERIPNTDAVSSVNNKTGAVVLTASDVGAASVGDLATKQDILTAGSNITINNNTISVDTIATPTDDSTKPITSGGVYTALQNKVNSSSLATVATSGSYNDLTNKPTIVPVDTAMSDTSTNTVQNKVIKAYVDANSGAVQSVNGKTGIVSLTASDVNALPSSTVIPTKTSDITNDSNFQTETQVTTAINSAIGTTSSLLGDTEDLT